MLFSLPLSACALGLGLGLGLAGRAAACVTAHTYMQNCILSGDTMSVQVWDDGRLVCDLGRTQHMASADSVFEWDEHSGCEPGWNVSATRNGVSVSITAANGYAATLRATDHHSMAYNCGYLTGGVGHERPLKGTQYEACLTDDNGCDGQEGCSLCDYRAKC